MKTVLENPKLTLVDHAGTVLSPDQLLTSIEGLAYCVTDSRGYFVEVNAGYEKLYGYTQEELIGNHFTMVVPAEARELLSELHSNFIAGEDELPTEYTVQRKDGSLIAIKVSAVRMQDGDNGNSKLTIIEEA